MSMDKMPVEYRPLSPMTYFLYNVLFMIPVIGFISVIIFSLSNANINRRNLARSFFCVYGFLLIAITIFGLSGGFTWVISKF